LGIRQLYLPTTDHFEPSLKDIQSAIQFIIDHQRRKEKVYVHCRAGHGRSAAIAMAWLLMKNPNVDVQQLNQELCQIRNVRKTLYQQPNLLKFHALLLKQQKQKQNDGNNDNDRIIDDDDDDPYSDTGRNQDDDDDDESQLYSFNNNIEDEL
jgi:protein-tyrosine phosphatase